MKQFEDILAAYRHIDGMLDSSLAREEDRTFKDRAYFILLMAQFEELVVSASTALIGKERERGDWRDRRPWMLFDEKHRRLSFDERLKLLIDPGTAEFAIVRRLYDERSKIAHGKSPSTAIDMTEIIESLKSIAARLQDAP